MGFFINNGGFALGQSMSFGSLDLIADPAGYLTLAINFTEGQAFRFGSLDFIANKLGKLCLDDSVFNQSVEISPSSLFGSSSSRCFRQPSPVVTSSRDPGWSA